MKQILLGLLSIGLALAPASVSAASTGLRPYGQLGMRSAALPQTGGSDSAAYSAGAGAGTGFGGAGFVVGGFALVAIILGIVVLVDEDDSAPVSS